jgi:hypothetical protein
MSPNCRRLYEPDSINSGVDQNCPLKRGNFTTSTVTSSRSLEDGCSLALRCHTGTPMS